MRIAAGSGHSGKSIQEEEKEGEKEKKEEK